MFRTLDVFHSGENAVQSLLGTRNSADAGKSYLHTTISEAVKIFLESQSLLAIGSTDNKGQLWASLRFLRLFFTGRRLGNMTVSRRRLHSCRGIAQWREILRPAREFLQGSVWHFRRQ